MAKKHITKKPANVGPQKKAAYNGPSCGELENEMSDRIVIFACEK